MRTLLVFVVLNVALALGNDLEEFTTSNRKFSANVYKELAAENSGNFVGCPMSTEIVLSMVHAGAKKQTAQQLATGLSLPDSTSKIKSMMKVVLPKLKTNPDLSTLKTVNKMYVNHDLKISQDFKTTATDVFQSGVESVDFKHTDETITKINKWVADSTEEQIKHLLEPSDITESTRAILVNALYFQGTWFQKFPKKRTKKANFFTNKLDTVEVDMMEIAQSYEFHQCGYLKAKILKMPYLGEDLSMVVILPNEKDGLAHVEANIEEALESQKFTHKVVRVNFPKFTTEATIKFLPILEKLGIVDLFKPTADLSGITSDDTPLYVTNVIQKNYIAVDEKGTVAAAATGTVTGLGGSFRGEENFIADHPFIYYINSPAGILFVGRYSGH